MIAPEEEAGAKKEQFLNTLEFEKLKFIFSWELQTELNNFPVQYGYQHFLKEKDFRMLESLDCEKEVVMLGQKCVSRNF